MSGQPGPGRASGARAGPVRRSVADVTATGWRTQLNAGDAEAVGVILRAAQTVDGTPALSDQARLGLRPGSRPGHHLLARSGDDPGAGPVVGYGALELEPTDADPTGAEPTGADPTGAEPTGADPTGAEPTGADPTGADPTGADPTGADPTGAAPAAVSGQAEIVVDPAHRRHGVGSALVEALIAELRRAADGRPSALGVWAHGDHDGAAGLAARLGFARDRVLWQMWMAAGDRPEPRYPAGVTIRPFEVGRDEDAWLRVNAAAFAHHPEQGRWTRDDLTAREAEPWFDPAGFFLAERDGDLVGFHWTKVHPGGSDHGRDAGEVYVVGVRPDAAGGGLGRALTETGVRHLAAAGVPSVFLYVDDDNIAAVRMYEKIGFRKIVADVSYKRIFPGRLVTDL